MHACHVELVTIGVRPSQGPQTLSSVAPRRRGVAVAASLTACAIAAAAVAWTDGTNRATSLWQGRLAAVTVQRDEAATQTAQALALLRQETSDHQRDLASAQRAADLSATAEGRIAQVEARLAEIAGERAQLVDAQVQLQLLAASNAETARRALNCLLTDPASATTRCQAELTKASASFGTPAPR